MPAGSSGRSGTAAHIYYKWEGVSPAGSHKPNAAVPQAYYNKVEGVKRLTTETGSGQWGSALAFACSLFEMECKVYMVKVSYERKPYRRLLMEAWGASCISSPSEQTGVGRAILARDPDSPGSLGIAIHAAVGETRRCTERGEAKTIAFGASGHGHFDLVSYQKYFAGELTGHEYPEELIRKAQASLPVV